MYQVTDSFVENSRKYGRQMSVRLTWDNNVLNDNQVFRLEKSFDADLFFTTMQLIEGEIKGRYDLTDKLVKVEVGISYNSSAIEYVNYGEFIVKEHERIVGANGSPDKTTFKAYDKMIKSHFPYDVEELGIKFPTSVINLLKSISSYMGLQLTNTSIVNGSMVIEEDKWTNVENVTYRNVLDEIAATSGTSIIIKDGKLFAKTVTMSNPSIIPMKMSIEENSMKSLKLLGKTKPINIVNLTREQSHANYPFPLNWNTIPEKDRSEIVIPDNQIMDKRRDEYAPSLFNAIKGISFYPFEADTYGSLHFEPLDTICVIDMNGIKHMSIVTSSSLAFTSGIIEKLKSYQLGYAKEKYALITDNRRQFMRVYFLVDQQNGKIEAIIEEQKEQGDHLTKLELEIGEINAQVSSMAVNVNIIHNANMEYDMLGWSFESNGYLKWNEWHRWYTGMTWRSMTAPVKVHSLSEYGIKFHRRGKAITPKGYVVPDSIYSFKAKRIEGNQNFRITVIEYKSDMAITKRTPFEFANPKMYEAFSIQPGNNTMYIALEYEVLTDAPFVLSEIMFNRGNPSEYRINPSDVKLWATAQMQILDDEIKLAVKDITIANGRLTSAESSITQLSSSITSIVADVTVMGDKVALSESKITQLSTQIVMGINANGELVLFEMGIDPESGSQIILKAKNIRLEGIVTVDGNFKVLEDGSIEVNNGMFRGEINTEKHVKVGDRVEFPVVKPKTLAELSQFTKSGKGGVLWGYDGTNSRAKLVYYDLGNLAPGKSRMIMTSDSDLNIGAEEFLQISSTHGSVDISATESWATLSGKVARLSSGLNDVQSFIHAENGSLIISASNRIDVTSKDNIVIDTLKGLYLSNKEFSVQFDTIAKRLLFLNNTPTKRGVFIHERGDLMPYNGVDLGSPDFRFATLYSQYHPNVSSTRDIKENVNEINTSILDRLEPVTYQKIGDEDRRLHMGFIAEDSYSVGSEYFAFNEKSIVYEEIIAPLVKGYQEQKELIMSQQRQIDTLIELLTEKGVI